MAKVIAVVNQKGGVGKTTASCHLAFAAKEAGLATLVVDFDTQGSASALLTGDENIVERPNGSEGLFGTEPLNYTKTLVEGITLLHGHENLEVLDDRRDEINALAVKMRTKVRQLPFDVVIFDTAPGMSPRHAAPMFWAHLALIMAEPSKLSMVGLKGTFKALRAATKVNPGLEHRIVVNRYLPTAGNQKAIRAELTAKFGSAIIAEFGGRSAVQEALEVGQPVWAFAKDRELRAAWKNFATRTLEIIA